MTDKEEFANLMTKFGCQPIVGCGDAVTLKEGEGKVEGYAGFFVDFEFDSEGKFIKAGIFE